MAKTRNALFLNSSKSKFEKEKCVKFSEPFFFFCFGSHENQTKKNEIAKEYTDATAVFRNLVSVAFLFHEGGSYLCLMSAHE